MDPCQPLQTCLLILIMIGSSISFLKESDSRENMLLTHHRILNQYLNVSDCWICTHSPVTASSMAYLAIPVPFEEFFNSGSCWDQRANSNAQFSSQWNVSVPIPLAGWTSPPWWAGVMASTSKDHNQYLAFKGGNWVRRNYTQVVQLGDVPLEELKIMFNRTVNSIGTPDAWKPSLLERKIIDPNWEWAFLFKNGNNDTCNKEAYNLWCNESAEYKPGEATCGNPDVGYCSPLGQYPGWCVIQNITKLIDLAHRLILQHSHLWDLPRGVYWACGKNAYKWLPVGVNGTCTAVRLTPATFIVNTDDLPVNKIPRHLLTKRATDNKPRPSGRPHLVQMSSTNKIFSTLFLYPMVMQTWDKLVEATDYLDDQIFEILNLLNASVAVQKQLITVTNQHTIVLDYITAAQGGMCQIVGPTCCHYVDTEGVVQITAGLDKLAQLREKHDKMVLAEEDTWWSGVLSSLNPANWFKGVGGWLVGILQGFLQIILILFAIYVVWKCLRCICQQVCRSPRSTPI
ncbi:uncharacterized protein LOC142194970 isoform X1 [Leptodactylus fuscus]|uniref:uncharacterized protein LOC142194970 isoform X1 n=2 Tax=Leptodactylus fuscus TaxID=238119 RepID=UPI003F4EEE32